MKTQNINQEVYENLLEINPTLAEIFKSEYIRKNPRKKKSNKPWPLKYDWYHHKRLNLIKQKYKFLEIILICLGDRIFRLKFNDIQKIITNDKNCVLIKGKKFIPALLNLNCKVDFAKRANCSVSSVENYLRALVRIGALQTHNLGDGKRHYSVGYWSNWSNGKTGDENKNGKKVNFYLNQSLAKKLINPEEFYLRK